MLSKEDRHKIIALLVSIIGATIIASTILHVLYTQILPINEPLVALLLLIPAAYIGLINEDVKESMLAMFITITSTIILTSFTRSIPAILGLFPHSSDVFAFQQITETIPLLFLVIPFFVIGTMIGVIVNEFILKTRY
jgi:hypothetical protein